MSMPVLFGFCHGMLNGDRDVSNYPVQWEFPMQPTTCLQWLLLWATAYGYGIAYCSNTLAITAYFVGGCYYLMAICEQFRHSIESIDKDVELYQNSNKPKTYQAFLQHIKVNLRKSIDLHANIFE